MICAWPFGAKFFHELIEMDRREVVAAQADGCPLCGGRLDRADFPRKPRGLPTEWEEAFSRRFSLCCSRDGCRRRVTPPSVRFLGRRIYVAAVVVLAFIAEHISVPARTMRRWAEWWRSAFTKTAFWRTARAQFMPPIATTELPASLVERFAEGSETSESAVLGALAFISPVPASPSFPRDGP